MYYGGMLGQVAVEEGVVGMGVLPGWMVNKFSESQLTRRSRRSANCMARCEARWGPPTEGLERDVVETGVAGLGWLAAMTKAQREERRKLMEAKRVAAKQAREEQAAYIKVAKQAERERLRAMTPQERQAENKAYRELIKKDRPALQEFRKQQAEEQRLHKQKLQKLWADERRCKRQGGVFQKVSGGGAFDYACSSSAGPVFVAL